MVEAVLFPACGNILMKASVQTMHQVWITRHGPPDVLELREAAVPQPSAGEVLIRVAAAGINFADIMARLGLYPDAPKPPCDMK
jgi:NADPH:quinone reductase-like Zn-dependent oxidoreductase